MNFQDCIAKEGNNEYDEKACWRLEITPPPEQLILHSWRVENGKEKDPRFNSVSARDIDPGSITIEEPHEEGDLSYLQANCIFYRDAITEKWEHDPSFLRNCVVLRYPISKDVSDVEAAKKCFQDFVIRCGARSPVINVEAIEDLLLPLRKALEPAEWTIKWAKAKTPTWKQTVEIESRQMLLIREMQRLKRVPYYKIPFRFWSQRKQLFPDIEQDTFELLSLDTTDVRIVPDEPSVWMTKLYAVERLDTRLSSTSSQPSNGYRMWYADVLFPTEADANNFSTTCANSVEQIRERLYKLHPSAA